MSARIPPRRPANAAARTLVLAALLTALAACEPGLAPDPPVAGAAAASGPRTLVVLACSQQVVTEFGLIGDAISGPPTPREALVVIGCSRAARATTTLHVVLPGETLTGIAAASHTTLAEVERLNPGLGPAAGRDWNRIVPGDLVVVPTNEPARGPRNLLVTQAPAGPPPPQLVPSPTPPPEPSTDYQRKSYEHAVKPIRAANDGRLAAWHARQDVLDRQWQAQALSQLGSLSGDPTSQRDLAGDTDLTTAFPEALATATALTGPHCVLALVDEGPPSPMPSLAGVHLTVVDLSSSDPAGLGQWDRSARAAGAARVTVLTAAAAHLSLREKAFA